MTPPLDWQLQEHIVLWWYIDKLPVEDIAHLARCSTSTVHNILSHFQAAGDPSTYARSGCPCILEVDDINFIHTLVQDNPVIFLD